MSSHRIFRRRPFQNVDRCVACGTKCPTLRDKRNHDAVRHAEQLRDERGDDA